MATVANTLNPAQTKSGFDLAKQMAPVALLGVVPNMLVAHPDVPVKSLKELVTLAKDKPDSLTFGTSGARHRKPSRGRIVQPEGRHENSSRCITRAAAIRRLPICYPAVLR